MLWREVGMMLGEPFERDFGFAASASRLLDGAESLSVL
jgi:hypothetical protein